MSYEGGRLAPWFDTTPNDRFCRRAAGDGGRVLEHRIRENTPEDTGALRASIRQQPLVIIWAGGKPHHYESHVSTDLDYAPPIEYGWGLWGPQHAKYRIRPKAWPHGWLHWVDPETGQDVFRKEVWHPGAPGAHMFVIGAGLTQAELPEIVAQPLARWRREVENQNRSGRMRSHLP